MKHVYLLVFASLMLFQAFGSAYGKANTAVPDTLSWSWEVTTTTSTLTKSCILEFTGGIRIDWGDGAMQTCPDSLSGTTLTHVYASVANFTCKAYGSGITYFKADSKRLLTLDPSRSPALTYLSCSSNQLASLPVGKCTELVSLYCSGNLLTTLPVATCTKLQTLTCSDNKLTSLDVSGVPSLKKLTCHTNSLTNLRLSKTGSLTYVSCMSCSLQVAALDTLIAQLPTLSTVSTSKNLYVLNNPGSSACNIQAALNKNWTPDKTMTGSNLYLSSKTCITGESVQLDVCLTNPVPVIAFELDMLFAPGFRVDTLQTSLATARKGAHLLSVAKISQTENRYKFMAYSMATGDVFKGSSGVLLQVCGAAPDSVQTYPIKLEKAVLVDTATNISLVTLTDGTLTVLAATVNGDVNGDRKVDVTDIANLVASINGRNPSGFNVAAADLDNNGILNVADITRLVVLINATSTLRSLSKESTACRALRLYDVATAEKGNHLYLRTSSSRNRTFELCLDNIQSIQACQVDLCLPEGVAFQTDSASPGIGRLNGHVCKLTVLGNGRYRLLLYALRPDAAFSRDTGALAVLPFEVSESLSAGTYPVYLESSVLTGMDLKTVSSDVFDLSVRMEQPADPEESLQVASDAKGMWIRGQAMTHIEVWDLSGHLRRKGRLETDGPKRIDLPAGLYLLRTRKDLQSDRTIPVMVR